MAGLQRLSVLIIDDHEHMLVLVRQMLRAFGFRHIRSARDGVEALSLLGEDVDLVITDWAMPGLDGLDLTRRVRAQGPAPTLPIIMLTGYAEASRIQAARDAGVTGYVAKPVRARELAGRINAAIHDARAFVQSQTYRGPDRRRGGRAGYTGPERRRAP